MWVAVVITAVALVFLATGDFIASRQPDRNDVATGSACYDPQTHQPRPFDDLYVYQFSDGTCMSLKEYKALGDAYDQLNEAQNLVAAAKQKDDYDVNLPTYQRLLQSRIGTETDVDAILSDVVTFYCQAEPKATSQQALWDVTKDTYDVHWHANTHGWPFDYATAVGAFGCSAYTDQYGGDSQTPPAPSIWG